MYEYTALTESHSIRVLGLQPAWKRGADLVIRLLEVSIDKPPNFEALSYAWESQELDQRIICDGDTLLISATCKAALVRLRRKRKPRLLWIDQICINQTSLKEKNHQVAIMGEIYSGAKRTIVWLGVNPESDKAVRCAQELRLFNFCYPTRPSYRVRRLLHYPHDAIAALLKKRAFYSANSIMWIHRIWTVQEVALARQVGVLTSRRQMDYDLFMHHWRRVHWDFSDVEYMVRERFSDSLISMMEARASARSVIKKKRLKKVDEGFEFREPMHPMHFLCGVTAATSSHPSDKIFAIHGVMKELGVLLPEPDYSMDTGEVYWKACAALMSQTRSLEPLMLVNGLLHWNSNVPSWVPDFNQTHRRIVEPPLSKSVFGWRSPCNHGAKFTLIDNDKIIATKAKPIDLIHGRTYQRTNPQSNRSGEAGLVREHIHAIHCFHNWILASETWEYFTMDDEANFDAVVELMFLQFDLYDENQENRRRLIRLLRISTYDPGAIYSLFRGIEGSVAKEKILSTPDYPNLPHLLEAQLLAVIEHQGLMEYFERMRAVDKGNALCRTKDGHIGIAPVTVAENDVVALIPGIRLPMILRMKSRNIFQVIGPAYMMGMMEGEQWKQSEGSWIGEEYHPPRRDLQAALEDNDVCDILLV